MSERYHLYVDLPLKLPILNDLVALYFLLLHLLFLMLLNGYFSEMALVFIQDLVMRKQIDSFLLIIIVDVLNLAGD